MTLTQAAPTGGAVGDADQHQCDADGPGIGDGSGGSHDGDVQRDDDHDRQQSERDGHGDVQQQFRQCDASAWWRRCWCPRWSAIRPVWDRTASSTCTVTLTQAAPTGGAVGHADEHQCDADGTGVGDGGGGGDDGDVQRDDDDDRSNQSATVTATYNSSSANATRQPGGAGDWSPRWRAIRPVWDRMLRAPAR